MPTYKLSRDGETLEYVTLPDVEAAQLHADVWHGWHVEIASVEPVDLRGRGEGDLSSEERFQLGCERMDADAAAAIEEAREDSPAAISEAYAQAREAREHRDAAISQVASEIESNPALAEMLASESAARAARPLEPRPSSIGRRKDERRKIRNGLGPSSSDAPRAVDAIRAAAALGELLSLATDGRLSLAVVDCGDGSEMPATLSTARALDLARGEASETDSPEGDIERARRVR